MTWLVEYARGVRLAFETAAARGVAALSRLVGAGAGMTVPGKLLSKLDPGAIDLLAARLPAGAAVVSATNGKTTTAAMAAEILRPRFRLAHNRSGANLVSGVASTLLAARDAELGLFEVDEAALPEVLRRIRPRAVCLGNLFRDQLDRYGELELIADRWRSAAAALPPETVLVVNGDDPQVGSLAERHEAAVVFGLDDPAVGRSALQHAADSKYCIRCGTPYRYAVAYVGHLGDYRCPNCGHARPPLEVVARAVELHGLESSSFELVTPEATQRVRRSGRRRSHAASARSLRRSPTVSLASVRRSGASSASRSATNDSSCYSSRTRPARTRSSARSSTAARRGSPSWR